MNEAAGRASTLLARLQTGLVAVSITTCFVSIFAAQLSMAAAALVFAARLARSETRWPRTPLDAPLLAFSVWTLLSAAFAANPLESHRGARQLLLFLLLYLTLDRAGDPLRRQRLLDAALLGGITLSFSAILQFHLLGFDTLNSRPHGLLGHYMTASGLELGLVMLCAARLLLTPGRLPPPHPADGRALALLASGLLGLALLERLDLLAVEGQRVFVAGLALATGLHAGRDRTPYGSGLPMAGLTLGCWALVLSQTRSAWLGALVGLGLLLILRAPRTLWVLPAAIGLLLIFRPEPVMRRLTVTDASSRDRYFMWQAGIDMVMEKPIFGQGPRMIMEAYPRYRWPGAPNPQQPHLHANPLQIAAERGLPGLAWWLWWIAAILADSWREWRATREWCAGGTLALMVALLAEGLFEYNLGDSEVLMFTLAMSALPYALRRQREGVI